MSIFTIGDLHLSFKENKPMNIFGENWDNHEEKIAKDWKSKVKDNDLVILPGDFSWAMYLKDSDEDFRYLNKLPGKKLLLKGNHDYWWSSQNKVVYAYPDMFFLKNNFFVYKDIAICGTRGWLCPNDTKFDESDKKIYERECIRLKLSLNAAVNGGYEKNMIVMLHYPPMNDKHEESGFTDIIKEYNGVNTVIYGHLHGRESIDGRFEGMLNGAEYRLVSADYLNFTPVKITE